MRSTVYGTGSMLHVPHPCDEFHRPRFRLRVCCVRCLLCGIVSSSIVTATSHRDSRCQLHPPLRHNSEIRPNSCDQPPPRCSLSRSLSPRSIRNSPHTLLAMPFQTTKPRTLHTIDHTVLFHHRFHLRRQLLVLRSQLVRWSLKTVVVIFTMAGLTNFLVVVQDADWGLGYGRMPFHEALYFVVVSFSTVG